MDKESYYGHIEYKRYIKITNPLKHDSLVSQLKYRLIEGNGRCIYMIGVEDNGTIFNITNEEYAESIENLKKMCSSVNAEIISTTKINYDKPTEEKYYYKVIINDIITDNEYRILNILNSSINYSSIDIVGIDSNNNILKLCDTNSYDLKKQSKYLIYINNISKIDILKHIINYKPHIINYIPNEYDLHLMIDKYIKLFNDLDISVVAYKNIYAPNNLLEIIKLKKESNLININSRNILSIFQTLFKGNILNNSKIYACIINNKICDENHGLYIYTFKTNTNDQQQNESVIKKQKLQIDEIYHIYQPVIKVNNDKLISISTLNELILNNIHICYNNCNCIENGNVVYADTINYPFSPNQNKIIKNKYYQGYYKNEVLKVKFIADKIILNKKVVLDENILIIDIESEFLFINI
jgi:hypothetical protein